MQCGEWDRFLKSGQRAEKFVGLISAYLDGYLKASSREVRIAHAYALKAVEKHGLESRHLAFIGDIISSGEAYLDRERHITFLHLVESEARWFQVTIKCCSEQRRLFVTTFHAMGADDITRKRRRYNRIWPVI